MGGDKAYSQFVTVSSWAQRELTFATRAGRVAARAEHHALAGPLAMQKEWAEIAALHRRNQRRHLAAARLHTAHAKRLNRRAHRPGRSQLPAFVAAIADACGTGSVVVALSSDTRLDAVVAASDAIAQAAHDLEVTFGEGPGRDAAVSDEPVLAAGGTLATRWPLYGPAVSGLGVHAISAAALGVSGRNLGMLTALHHPATPAVTVPVRGVAEALTRLLLAGRTATDHEGLPRVPLLDDADDQLVIHQAAGMVAAEAGVDIPAATAIIRSRAFAEGLPAGTVAARVVSRDLDLVTLA